MNRKKILVIDDETEFVDMLKMRLEANRYEVITAADGAEGVDKALKEGPDLIILDIVMPKMDGYQVLLRLKNEDQTRHVPIVMLTAKSESGSIFRSQELRADDYLIKPFDTQELLDLVGRYTA